MYIYLFMQCWLSYFANRNILVTATETIITVGEVIIIIIYVSWIEKDCVKSHHIINLMFIYE